MVATVEECKGSFLECDGYRLLRIMQYQKISTIGIPYKLWDDSFKKFFFNH